jgi:hypothetical protein
LFSQQLEQTNNLNIFFPSLSKSLLQSQHFLLVLHSFMVIVSYFLYFLWISFLDNAWHKNDDINVNNYDTYYSVYDERRMIMKQTENIYTNI